jgi:hypothetical protein
MAPPSSNQMISINWNHLTESRLASYVPFQITMHVFYRNIPNTIIDEGDSISILFLNSWQGFGSLQLTPVTQNQLTFDRRVSKTLRILPLFRVTLGGKKVCVDVIVVNDTLNFNFLLRRDYVYVMRDFVSTLFQVICFPHNGDIVMMDQISFIEPHLMVNHPPSLKDPYMSAMSSPLQVNYVMNFPMHSTLHER